MRREGLVAIVVMNHDDYRYLFGTDRSQPRALIPAEGPPELIAFTAEEPELRASFPAGEVRVFSSVGGQIHDIVGRLHELVAATGIEPGARPKVGMQLWFDTPAFLVDLFRRVNPGLELVSSDPVMDPIRGIKDADELTLMIEAQRIAGLGMERARAMLQPGVTAHEVATEALYAMMRAGAEKTSTPVWVNFGIESCMLHGRQSPKPLAVGELAIIDLTPQVEGYCANLARTFVLGEPDERQRTLLDAYGEVVAVVCDAMRPGVTVGDLDARAHEVYERRGLADYHVYGIGHGIGLRFEEPPHRRSSRHTGPCRCARA
jgi:Xaa-Pro aminopeptidase